MPQWFVYLVRCRDNTLYCGIAAQIARRMAEHNSGKGAKYIVPSRRPVECVWKRRVRGRPEALSLEYWIKKQSAALKREMAEGRLAVRRDRRGTWKTIARETPGRA